MADIEEKPLSQGVDYLGFLNGELRGLQGFTTLAHELIQNADDAKASWVSFDVGDEALVIENDAVFSDCSRDEDRVCQWLRDPAKGHSCDLHRFRNIAGGDKRRQGDTIGAFGIGFISVYQVTDSPEMLCGRRHWIIRPEKAEGERIWQKVIDELPRTRFRLPWATDPESEVRKALEVQPFTPEMMPRMVDELSHTLTRAITFLRHVNEIRLLREGVPVKLVRLERAGDRLDIQDGDGLRVWHLIRGSFEREAKRLQESSGITHGRKPDVTIALPEDDEDIEGLLFAFLPTQHRLGLTLHLNADFFPSSDRQRILFGDDYQGRWNKAAIVAAAEALSAKLPDLTKLLSHTSLWKLLQQVRRIYSKSLAGQPGHIFNVFWETLREAINESPIVFTSAGAWVLPEDARLLTNYDEEGEALPILEGLRLKIVHEDLKQQYSLLQEIGVKVLGAPDMSQALRSAGLDRAQDRVAACGWVCTGENHEILGREIGRLLAKLSGDRLRLARQDLGACVIGLSRDDRLVRPQDLLKADEETVEILTTLGLRGHFLSIQTPEAIAALTSSLTFSNAVELLEEVSSQTYDKLWSDDMHAVVRLIRWLESYSEHIVGELRDRVRTLPIWPSGDRLYPLDELLVPGDFIDPLQISSIIDLEACGADGKFLLGLGAKELTINSYASGQVKRAFDKGIEVGSEGRHQLVQLFTDKFSYLADDDNVWRALSACPIVECTDGEFRNADEVYFHSEDLSALLGEGAPAASVPGQHHQATKTFLAWLGVADKPRVDDILARIQYLIKQPPRDTVRGAVQRIFAHLAQRWADDLSRGDSLEQLKALAWLPAQDDGDRWHRPTSLYSVYRHYLFFTQADFLDIPQQDRWSGFLECLGVKSNPPLILVVNHLLEMARTGRKVNTEVYTTLNRDAANPTVLKLKGEKCLLLDNERYVRPDQVFWEDPGFGRYRFRLSHEWRAYGAFCEQLGVRERPTKEDALAVLKEASVEFGSRTTPLDAKGKSVVMHCWKLLNDSSEQELRELRALKTIPDNRDILEPPVHIFFDDRPGLAGRFGTFLQNSVIPRPQDAWSGMQAAGVRPLSEAVQTQLVARDDPIEDEHLRERVLERQVAIARVTEAHRTDAEAGWNLDVLRNLRFEAVGRLLISHTLPALKRYRPTDPVSVASYYDHTDQILYYVRSDGAYPWSAIARELAYALNPQAEAGKVAPGLKEVLSANSLAEASQSLDELGYATLDAVAEDLLPSAAVGLGATKIDISNISEPTLSDPIDQVGDEEVDGDGQSEVAGTSATSTAAAGTQGGDAPSVPLQPARRGAVQGANSSTAEVASERKDGKPDNAGTTSGGDKAKDRPTPERRARRGRLLSYVVPPGDFIEGQPDKAAAEHRTKVDGAGIAKVLAFEKAQGREAKTMPPNNEGYDFKSYDGEGNLVRYIEVKSLSADWDADMPTLSDTQFLEYGLEIAERYWLYVVERATNEDYEIHRIQNPARRVTGFSFDKGWIALRENNEGDAGSANADGSESLRTFGGRGQEYF